MIFTKFANEHIFRLDLCRGKMLDFHDGDAWQAVLRNSTAGIFSWTRVEGDFRDAELKTSVMSHVKNPPTWDGDGREGPQVIKIEPRGATPNHQSQSKAPARMSPSRPYAREGAAVTSTHGTDGAADRPYDRARTAVALSPLAVLVPVHLFSYMCYYTKNYDVN